MVVPKLEVPVYDLPTVPTPRPPVREPAEELDDRPRKARPRIIIGRARRAFLDAREARAENRGPTVVYLPNGDLVPEEVQIFEAPTRAYRGIRHENLIVDIGEAVAISSASLDAVRELGTSLDLGVVPINVRRSPR